MVATREVLGLRDLTHAEATSILGARIGRPDLPYVRLPYGELAADLHVRMGRALNDGTVRSQGRTSASTTTTGLEDFAEELARACLATVSAR